MCSRAAALGTLRDLGQLRLRDFTPEMWPRPHIAPTDPMPVLRAAGETLVAAVAAWGKPGSDLTTTHARADRVAGSPLWAPLAASRSCRGVAVVTHAWEPFTARTVQQMGDGLATANVGAAAVAAAKAGQTVWHGVRRRDGDPLLLACLVDAAAPAAWMSLVTVPSGTVLARVHRAKDSGQPREAALLPTPEDALAWLDMGDLDALRGGTEAELEWWRAPDGCMGRDVGPLVKLGAWSPVPKQQRTLF